MQTPWTICHYLRRAPLHLFISLIVGIAPAVADENLRFRGGLSYFDVPFESKVGGAFSLDGYLPLTEWWGAYGGAKVNHFSGGTQFLGELGVFKEADPSGCHGWDRVGAAVMFDQFTDSRPDDLYVSRLRIRVGYALDSCWGSLPRAASGRHGPIVLCAGQSRCGMTQIDPPDDDGETPVIIE